MLDDTDIEFKVYYERDSQNFYAHIGKIVLNIKSQDIQYIEKLEKEIRKVLSCENQGTTSADNTAGTRKR
jgi:type II secretory pathway component PulL